MKGSASDLVKPSPKQAPVQTPTEKALLKLADSIGQLAAAIALQAESIDRLAALSAPDDDLNADDSLDG